MLDPTIYQALHQGTPGDVEFYLARVSAFLTADKNADERADDHAPIRVLELGCGAGRLTLALAELGSESDALEIVGVDHHPGLLSAAHEKLASLPEVISSRVTLLERDFTTLSASDVGLCAEGDERAQFDLILLPYNGLYCLASEESQVELLRSASALLKPGGSLWIDGYALPDPDEYDYESEAEYAPLTALDLGPAPEDPELQREIGVEELDHFEPETQRLTISYRYCTTPERASVEPLEGAVEEIKHRYIYPWQLSALSERAGVSLSSLYADFDERDFDDRDFDESLPDGAEHTLATHTLATLSELELRALPWGIELEVWVAEFTA